MNYITDILKWLNQSSMHNYIVVLLALIPAIYFYLKSKKEITPCFRAKSFQIISDNISNIEDITVLFKGSRVTNLTTTKVAFWNKGKLTLNQTDIAIKDPLSIVINGDAKILKAQVIFQTKEANNFSTKLSYNNETDEIRFDDLDAKEGNIELSFDYLDTNEGAIIEIFHTGSSELRAIVKGSIKSVSKIYDQSDIETPMTFMVIAALTPNWLKKLIKYNEWLAMPFIVFYVPIIMPFLLIDKATSPLRKIPSKFNI